MLRTPPLLQGGRSRRRSPYRALRGAAVTALGVGSSVVVVLFVGVVAGGGLSSGDSKMPGGVTGHGASTSTSTSTSTTTTVANSAPHGAAGAVHTDPLTTRAARAWISSRRGGVTAAVLDLVTHREWVLHPAERAQTASIIKVDILEALLHQNEPLSESEDDEAQGMIEQSDDDDATELWNAIGGAEGISDYNAKAGLTQTTPNTGGYWGETTTSAVDQIKILKQLARPSKLLGSDDKAYALNLMRQVDLDQRWGVTGGVPHGVSVALKNGWVPLSSATDWEINSIGWIDGDRHDYLLAVLTKHDPSEAYGIATIDKLSADIYGALGRTATGSDP
jgi:beta-lactamase class A